MFSCLLCHSSVTEWEATRLRRLYTPSPLTCTSSHCLCVCYSYSCPSSVCLPPFKHTHRQSAHTRCLHANTKTCMDVLRTNTYTQTDTSCSRGRTALQTLWLSALDSRLWSVYFVLHSCQLGYIRLICVCTCLKQFEGIHV